VEVARGGSPRTVAATIDPVDPQALLVPLAGPVRPGTSVRWRLLSQDGHVTSGRYVHGPVRPGPDGVGAGPSADGGRLGDWVAGAGRLLVLLGAVMSLGLVAFRWVVAIPAWASGGLAPPGAPSAEAFRERAGAALSAAAGGWHRAWRASAAVWAVGVPLIAVGTLMAVEGGAGDLGTLLSETRVGTGIVVIAVAAATGVALGAVTRRRLEGAAPSGSWAVVLGAPSVAALAAMSWMGHASSGNDVTLNVGADLLHNGATAAWIGGLLGLLAYLLPAGAALAEGDRMRLVAQGVVRFSTLATVCVAVLVITGVYRALAEVGALSDLVDTGYGIALLVKLALFAVMLAGGGYNRFVLHPRLERAALGLPGGESAAGERLARSVRAELVLAGLLLVAVAVLVSSAPTV